MVLEPRPILTPGMSYDIPSCLTNSLYGLRAAPAWDTCAEADKVCSNVDGSPESEVVIYKPIASREPLDQPQCRLNVLVQEKLVELCNHLPEIQWPHTQLTHLPINHEDRRLVLGLEILIRNENTVAFISTFTV